MSDQFGKILVIVVTIEAIAEIFVGLRDAETRKWNTKLLIALTVGVVVSLMIPEFDAFAAVDVTVIPPIAGRILTGILASRGAKLFHDFLAIVETYKQTLKNNVAAK